MLYSYTRSTPGGRSSKDEERKVRASLGRVQDNVLSRQLEGKYHRNIPLGLISE
jgi:hypothetical protein